MINFPILVRLDVSDYGLYPGSGANSIGLHIDFKPGLTLILGANGLGKSTLVKIIYRLLTGPYDIPGLADQIELGTLRLEPRHLPRAERITFANRVLDAAVNAKARLSFTLGDHNIIVERKLSNLALTFLSIDNKVLGNDEQEIFQNEILKLVGVWSFGDWILLLRHLTFYFEDRRALVWDASAQRQILRFLFLPVATARKWSEDERSILEYDSRMRNLRNVLGKEEADYVQNESKAQSAGTVLEELQKLEVLHRQDRERQEILEEQLGEMEAERQRARLKVLQAEQDREAHFREFERSKLIAINARFPKRSETARYILAQLMTESRCMVCDNVTPAAATFYSDRIAKRQCVICGTDLERSENVVPPSRAADKQVQRAETDLRNADKNLTTTKQSLSDAEQAYDTHFNEIQQLSVQIAERSTRIGSLVRRLPPAEAQMHQQRADLASMRTRVEHLRRELDARRQLFAGFIEEISRDISRRSEAIKNSFDSYAEGFLLEVCRLTWSMQKDRLGQSGAFIDFPAFEVAMTGADFVDPVRRTGPEQVSESQREFIDLAFRMALMSVAGNGRKGTLVIDAPESSLDAVFVGRASDVLSRFAKAKGGNRLVVTSNIVEGRLIPSLLTATRKAGSKAPSVVDLFAIATPTVATRTLENEYRAVRLRLLKGQGVMK